MLKNMFKRKMVLTTLTLILLGIMYFVPKDDTLKVNLDNKQSLEYVYNNIDKKNIYLLDSNNYVSLTTIAMSNSSNTTIEVAKNLIEALIIDGKKNSKIPSGFKPIIPANTSILDIKLDNDIITVKFSKEFLDIDKDLEEKLIEAVVYTLTSIEEVKGVIIYVEDEMLTVLPKNKVSLPKVLNRSIGINKKYDISTINNVSKTTIYYVNKTDDNYYYVPVTKYNNDTRDKIQVIIDELASGPIYETNLMSFLNSNTKLIKNEQNNKDYNLEFNSYILSDIDNRMILEEVLYSIALSVNDNYDVNKVNFIVEDKEIKSLCLKECN